MSEPTYRIETEHDPSRENCWSASAYRVSDNSYVAIEIDVTEDMAVARLRDTLAALSRREMGHTLYLNENGDIMPEPQSLRVAP